VKNQEQAISMNGDGDYKDTLKERLKLYKQHKPYRVAAKK
jgi:hypothetical protein